MFIDYAKILISAGKGGDGAVAFRKEKFVPKGGPSGGNGGRGGNIKFVANENLGTLLDFRYNKKYEAENGVPGGKSLKDGRNGKDIIIQVPVGTIIKDEESGMVICDLDKDGFEFIAAKGGKGGKGNSNFATATNQTPRYAEDGRLGESKSVILELKLIADVGLVGFPNAGKSTFISVVSAAKPKIADYPFTTLQPNLGIVQYKDFKSFTVADIPGIIEGAHEGKGLGHQFLRHIERTGILLVMIDCNEEDIPATYNILVNELEKYSPVLAKKPRLLVITKIDTADEEKQNELNNLKIDEYDSKIYKISSVARFGINQMIDTLWEKIQSEK